MLSPIYSPGAIEEFMDPIVPELQRRGLFEYTKVGLNARYCAPTTGNDKHLNDCWKQFGLRERPGMSVRIEQRTAGTTALVDERVALLAQPRSGIHSGASLRSGLFPSAGTGLSLGALTEVTIGSSTFRCDGCYFNKHTDRAN